MSKPNNPCLLWLYAGSTVATLTVLPLEGKDLGLKAAAFGNAVTGTKWTLAIICSSFNPTVAE